jgi:hypothetical protein
VFVEQQRRKVSCSYRSHGVHEEDSNSAACAEIAHATRTPSLALLEERESQRFYQGSSS